MTPQQDKKKTDITPDAELMKRVRRGEEGAFADLIRRHQNSLVNFFMRMGVYDNAKDLAQETFIRLFKYRKRYRKKAKFTTFLYLMARQVRIDYIRREARRKTAMEDLALESEIRHEQKPRRREGARIDIEETLAQLPEDTRSVIVMNMYQGLRYRDIAAALGVPIGTVKSRMFNGLRKLKELMKQ
ncbi:MAG: sigma-70 family RNA polymerase sigma factor [Kiritimatiellia bacterium]